MNLDILVIENNPADARLTMEAFREVGVYDGVLCMPDGEEALHYLTSQGGKLPHLIFLDLDLPRVSGLRVLEELKSNETLRVIPVVVVSGCKDPRDIRRAYELHASCFIYKPSDLNQFLLFIRACYEFWGTVVTLPPAVS